MNQLDDTIVMMENSLNKIGSGANERNELGLNVIGEEGDRQGSSPLKIEANGLFGDDNFD